jgi:UDP-2-acetamido-3-amino-2,3-dideoxy-glucuronate N-acetyltransferase
MSAARGFFAHPTAVVDEGASVGEGTRIWHFSHVMAGARIGRGCTLGQNVFVAAGTTLGDNVKVQNNVSIYEGVHLEDDVFCGPSMVFTNVVNPRSHVSRRHEFLPTRVGRGATLGANSTIVCGHVVGRYAFVAAGAVVVKDVPEFALVMGVPGRIAGYMCACGVRLPVTSASEACPVGCAACGASYRWTGSALEEAAR